MKTLILSCSTGQGHNSASMAVLQELQRRGLPCEMADTLSFGSRRASAHVSDSYADVTRYVPLLFGSLYRLGEVLSSPDRKSPVYLANTRYAGKLAEYIVQNGFDTVLCPHLFPAEAMTYLRQKRGLKVRSYGLATDYTCSPFWEETDIDCFFLPHQDMFPECVRKGFSPQRLAVTGIPVSADFRQKTPRNEARRLLGLPAEGTLYLVMTGSMGFGNVVGIVAALLGRMAPDSRALVMTGGNERLNATLNQRFGADGRVMRVPYTKQVPLYMDACDVLLSKPGGLSSTEAAAKNVPLVHTAPIPGGEVINARFFAGLGLSIATRTPQESAMEAVRLAADRQAQENQLAAQRRHINADAAVALCNQLIARA